MRIELKNSGPSAAMGRHYQRLIEAGYGPMISKKTRTIKGARSNWDIEETTYEIILNSEIESDLLFNLSDVLQQELVLYRESDHPVIEIYDDWRE